MAPAWPRSSSWNKGPAVLHFDFDTSEIARLANEFGASPKQLELAYARALRRTASTLRTQARKGLRETMGLRSAKEIRRRMYGFKFRKGDGMGSVRMWFGFNDLRASAFKGRPRRTPRGASIAGREVEGAFVGKNRAGQRTIMRRAGRRAYPIAEARIPVDDAAEAFVEDEVFDQVEEIFFRNFRAEIKARTIYEVGK